MELFPGLQIGWINGWLAIVLLALTEGLLFLVSPKEVVKRLFDRSGWSQRQKNLTIAGKLCTLVCLTLVTLTPLKLESPVFWVGGACIVLGLAGLVKAIIDFRDTPLGQPVTKGIYRISRHPQIVMASLVILGACIAAGSWPAVFFWTAARLLEHFSLLAEEETCLKRYGSSYQVYLQQVPRYFIVF
ncbi:MAG TPA: methyltransferase [Anaerolineaceae bacterium]|nr:methyltransferase [Anaerolineaceae bacterium]HPN52611.1 methyltransferase [Anaerolineaceae bacterium]